MLARSSARPVQGISSLEQTPRAHTGQSSRVSRAAAHRRRAIEYPVRAPASRTVALEKARSAAEPHEMTATSPAGGGAVEVGGSAIIP
jgi:hypothetical protein